MSTSVKWPSIYGWLRRIVAALLALSFVFLMVSILHFNTVPSKYLWLALPVYGGVTGLAVWVLLDGRWLVRRKIVMTVTMLIVLLMASANVYGVATIRSANALLGGVQNAKTTYVEYAIITDKNRAMTLDSAQRVALISNDPLYEKAKVALANETSAAQYSVDHLAGLKNALASHDTDLAAVRTGSLGLIKDEDAVFYNNLAVLRTFRVESASEQNAATIDATKPYAIYISGIDTFGSVSTVSRSDVNMLLVVNPTKRTMLLVNTPRDYYVQLHGTTGLKDKLTHAGVYGVDMSRQTVEDLYGISIPYSIRVNFSSLENVITAVGPIDVYSDYDFKSYHTGYNTLDSKQALEFARERYSFSEGDRQRGKNQQHVIEAIVGKMARPENAVRLPQIMDGVRGSVETNMSEASLKAIIRNQLDDIRGWRVTSISVDGSGASLPTYSYGSTPLYVMIPDETSVTTAKQQIAEHLSE